MTPEDFMKNLGEQASPAPETINEKLMKKFTGWVKARTNQYLSFADKGKTDYEYLGHMFKRACIPRDEGLEYVKRLGWYDDTRCDDAEAEFSGEFGETKSDSEWREKIISKYL